MEEKRLEESTALKGNTRHIIHELWQSYVTLSAGNFCFDLSEKRTQKLRLHYVPGGHGSHNFHRGRNGGTVTQRRGTGSTNVAPRSCRDRRDRFLNSQEICHCSHGGIDLLKCAVVERGNATKRDRTKHTLTQLGVCP